MKVSFRVLYRIIPFLVFIITFSNTTPAATTIRSDYTYHPWGISTEKLEYYDSLLYRYRQIDPSKASELSRSIQRKSLEMHNQDLYIWALYQEICALTILGEIPDSTQGKINSLIDQQKSKIVNAPLALLYLSQAQIELSNESYEQAYKNCLIANAMASQLQDSTIIQLSNIAAGTSLAYLGEYEQALALYHEARLFFLPKSNFYRNLLIEGNIISAEVQLGFPKDSVLSLIHATTQKILDRKDSAFLHRIYMMTGDIHLFHREFDSCWKYYNLATRYESMQNNPTTTTVLYHNIALLYILEGKPKNAIPYLEKTKIEWEKQQSRLHLMRTYSTLSDCMAALGNYKEAYHYLQESNMIKETHFGSDKVSLLQKTNLQHIITEKDHIIGTYKKNEELSRSRFTTLVSISVLSFLLLVSIAIIFFQKYTYIQKQKNKENQIFTMEIDSKNRELASSFLLLSNKNGILSKIQHICTNAQDDNPHLKQISNIIESSVKSDEEWQHFQLHFNKVHPNFFDNIRRRFPLLTENDIRLCAYIKIGLKTKEIATINHISCDSVKTNRYRLKKRMNLPNDMDIEDVLMNL